MVGSRQETWVERGTRGRLRMNDADWLRKRVKPKRSAGCVGGLVLLALLLGVALAV